MRNLLVVLIIVLASVAAVGQCSNTSYGNGWTCVQQKGAWQAGAGNTTTVTPTTATTAGRGVLLFVTACYNNACGGSAANVNGMNLTMATSSGNTVVASPGTPFRVTDGTLRYIMGVWWVPSVSAAQAFTVTCSGGNAGSCWYLANFESEWIGGDSSGTPFDKDGGAAGTSTAAPSLSLATTTNATNLIAGFISGFNGNTYSPGTTPLVFKEVGEDLAGEQHQAVSVIATGAHACKWTSTAQAYNAVCVAIKAASGGGPPATMVPRHKTVIIR